MIVAAIGTVAVALKAELPSWSEDIIARSALESALFRIMGVPDGVVTHIRPPWEARAHLGTLLQHAPHDAELYAIRAREEERSQDYPAAEADWKQLAGNSADPLTGLAELADFYHRRLQTEQELKTLLRLGGMPAQANERFKPASLQPQWAAFSRAVTVANDALLPASEFAAIFNAWIERYSREKEPYQGYLDWAVQQHDRAAAQAAAERIRKAFPDDLMFVVTSEANLAQLENGTEAELAVYAKNFSPLWPDDLKSAYFKALGKAHQPRTFLADAEASIAAHPVDLDPVGRLYFYYEQENRKDAADQQLLLFLSRKAAQNAVWTPGELKTVAMLFQNVQDYDESAHADYMLYRLPSARDEDKDWALAEIISMLLAVPEQPLRFGNRDLSLYKNIARMDRHPGFLNGILSLALNTTFPEYQYQNASQNAISYFHRASASELLDRLKQQFPKSPYTAGLEAELYRAYSVYGQYDAILRFAPAWLNRNATSEWYVDIALLLASAYMQKGNTANELALYDRLLTELAEKSGHMPLGEQSLSQQVNNGQPATAAEQTAPRSPDYARVLDRYISRLVQLNRSMDAVRLFRREIDRNPDDPGIYERLALFFEQNQLDSDVAQTYREAFMHFKDMSWASKLARFYLREKENTAYQDLTRQITDTFRGSQVAAFLTGVSPTSPVLYRQINLYAHQRFPQNLVFVRNLMTAYLQKETQDSTAYGRLLREYWYYDSGLRTAFFEYLSRTGQLRKTLAALPTVERASGESNVAALEFMAEGHAWLTEYETAAPAFVRLAAIAPGSSEHNDRAISIERSLAPGILSAFDTATHLAEQDVRAAPGNLTAITRVGEIYADRELYSQSRPWWNRVAAVYPGSAEGYLSSATVFWDYFQFNDALRVIREARQKLREPAKFSYEAGAIFENEGKYKEAIAAYIDGALHDSSQQSKDRLLTLARRKASATMVDEATAKLTAGGFDAAAFGLRLAILEKQNRRQAIGDFLSNELPRAASVGDVAEIRTAADRLGFDDVAAQCLERIVSLTDDPVEKMQARIELGRFYEIHNNAARAQNEFSSLLTDHPNILGVIRATVDFYWREKQGTAAVHTLDEAATRAQQPYQNELRREAAEKASESGQYEEARRLLDLLLANDPYNGDLLAAKATTYARQNDRSGLVAFYAAELSSMQSAPLTAQEKTDRIAALGRGYILALTAVKQFREALEQYQQILNAYPEDGSLATEAARFADDHQLAAVLTDYYEKATADSPRDYRWPLILARIDSALRRYSEAITAYDKAAYVRPDRADIVLARVDLETRLLRFENALKSYQKLYELSYHDPQYLAAQAITYARMGNHPEVIRLLRAAYVEQHPHEPSGYILAMRQAASWHMFQEVDRLFGELRPLLTPNGPSIQDGLQVEAKALVALHRPMDAITLVASMVPQPANRQPLIVAIGTAMREYLTPEEKLAFIRQSETPGVLPATFDMLQLSKTGGFADIQAKLLAQYAAANANGQWMALNQLQSSRLLYDQLGGQLEEIAKAHLRQSDYPQILTAAFEAYQNAGNVSDELRLADYSGNNYQRLFVNAEGNLAGRLSALAAHNPKRAYSVVQYVIANRPADEAVQAIQASAPAETNLWASSYTALTGLYFLSPAVWVTQAFDTVLGPRTVGSEIASKSGEDALHGTDWYYYAARYGDYLGYRHSAGAQDYLPASVEANPAASTAYMQLGDNYRELKQPVRAAQLYEDALQLSPERADVYDRLALLAIASNNRAQAIARWRRAFAILAERVEQGPLAPDYWQTAETVLIHINRFRATQELKSDADKMLRAYAKRNASYNFTPFLQGILIDSPDRQSALAWIIELSEMPELNDILGQMLSSNWVPEFGRDALYQAQINHDRQALNAATGSQPVEGASQRLIQDLTGYARYLDSQQRWPEEWLALQQIEPASRRPQELLLKSGALTGHLDELIHQYNAEPASAPSGEQALAAASALTRLGKNELALQIEEFEYQRELQSLSPPASAWFGLARVRFAQRRNPEALSLVRDVTVSIGAPFENLSEAIRLLEQAGLKDEAAQYATEWKTAEPWNEDAQLAFGRLKADVNVLDQVRRSASSPYSIRVEASHLLRDLSSARPGTDELALLTHKVISPAQAKQPFYVEARLDAARESSLVSEKIRLYREAIAINPELQEPRLDIAESAFAEGHTAFGLAAFASYNNSFSGDAVFQPSPTATSDQPPAKFLVVERLAAEALVRQQDFSQALQLYDDLLRRSEDPSHRAEIRRLRDSAKAKQDLMALNAARQPLVHAEVAQSTIVKPKLKTLPADYAVDIPRFGEEQ